MLKLEELKMSLMLLGFEYSYVNFSDHPWHCWRKDKYEVCWDINNDYCSVNKNRSNTLYRYRSLVTLLSAITQELPNGNTTKVKKRLHKSKNSITFS